MTSIRVIGKPERESPKAVLTHLLQIESLTTDIDHDEGTVYFLITEKPRWVPKRAIGKDGYVNLSWNYRNADLARDLMCSQWRDVETFRYTISTHYPRDEVAVRIAKLERQFTSCHWFHPHVKDCQNCKAKDAHQMLKAQWLEYCAIARKNEDSIISSEIDAQLERGEKLAWELTLREIEGD